MARRFYTALIVVYIGTGFFCVFARIESWPFSDYRVFENNLHPGYLRAYAPWLKLSNGEYFNPGTKDIYYNIDRPYFHEAFRKMPASDLEKYLSSLAKSKKIRALAAKMRSKGLDPVKLVPMEFTFEKRNSKWTPNPRPFKEYDIF